MHVVYSWSRDLDVHQHGGNLFCKITRKRSIEELPSLCARQRYSISRPQPLSVRAALPFPLPTQVQGRVDRYEAEVNQRQQSCEH